MSHKEIILYIKNSTDINIIIPLLSSKAIFLENDKYVNKPIPTIDEPYTNATDFCSYGKRKEGAEE